MNSASTYKISTTAAAATLDFGEKIGRLLKSALVIEMVGDLGSGKTTLVQGILVGLGYSGDVPSPTFTVERVYPVPNDLRAYHVDFYRLTGHDVATDELDEIMGDPHNIVLAEWPGNGAAVLPPARLRITLKATSSATTREILLESLGGAGIKIIEGLKHVSRH